jgi:CelD/BcsL family acetyltransferase involved in cellulose biosynthesis
MPSSRSPEQQPDGSSYPPATAELTIEEITSAEQLKSIAPIWDSLLAQSARPEIYLTYEWMSTWWQCFRDESRHLKVLLVRESGQPVGIAPLMLTNEHLLGLRVRTVAFLTTRRFADAPTNFSASLDFITVPSRSAEVLHAVMTYLTRGGHDWDFVRLHPIPGSSATIQELTRLSDDFGLSCFSTEVIKNAYVFTGMPWEQHLNSLSKNFRKQLRAQERKLAALGPIEYELVTNPSDIDRAIEDMMNIERRSWKWNVGISINSVAFRNFYPEFARTAVKRGWLNLWLMHINGENIVYEFAVIYNGQAEILKGSFDNQYHHYSPGNQLAQKEFETYFGTARRIGLLWGDAAAKQRWQVTFEPHHEIHIFNTTLYARCLHALIARAHIYFVLRHVTDISRRLARKLHIRLRTSELTREDQVHT